MSSLLYNLSIYIATHDINLAYTMEKVQFLAIILVLVLIFYTILKVSTTDYCHLRPAPMQEITFYITTKTFVVELVLSRLSKPEA